MNNFSLNNKVVIRQLLPVDTVLWRQCDDARLLFAYCYYELLITRRRGVRIKRVGTQGRRHATAGGRFRGGFWNQTSGEKVETIYLLQKKYIYKPDDWSIGTECLTRKQEGAGSKIEPHNNGSVTAERSRLLKVITTLGHKLHKV